MLVMSTESQRLVFSQHKAFKKWFKLNARQRHWETRFKNKLYCLWYWWTWTGTDPIEVESTGTIINPGDTAKISKVCNPNFIDGYGDDCAAYASENWCTEEDQAYFLEWSIYNPTKQSYQTGLNCPQCGCNDTYIVPLTDRPVEDLVRSDKKSKGGKKWFWNYQTAGNLLKFNLINKCMPRDNFVDYDPRWPFHPLGKFTNSFKADKGQFVLSSCANTNRIVNVKIVCKDFGVNYSRLWLIRINSLKGK